MRVALLLVCALLLVAQACLAAARASAPANATEVWSDLVGVRTVGDGVDVAEGWRVLGWPLILLGTHTLQA